MWTVTTFYPSHSFFNAFLICVKIELLKCYEMSKYGYDAIFDNFLWSSWVTRKMISEPK